VVELRGLLLADSKDFSEEVAFRPNDAVDRLARGASNRADWESLRGLLDVAIVAFGLTLFTVSDLRTPSKRHAYLLDHLDLSQETRRSTLNQRNVCDKAHAVDMPPSIEVVQRIENEGELCKPVHVELRVLDIAMMRFDLDIGVEPRRGLLRDLYVPALALLPPLPS
jgi:hypothetical protein